ncbi:MAG: hypothetical protein AAGB15_15305, partial [Pseudomonadota bacterium]
MRDICWMADADEQDKAKDVRAHNPGPPRLVWLLHGIAMGLTGGKVAFIHTRRDMRRRIRAGEFFLFNLICDLLREMGYQVALMPLYRPPYLRWVNRRCLHIYRGPGRNWRGPGVVTIARGYIDGYYYIDPLGHRENSSIGAREFVPRDVPAEEANIFFRRLRRRYVRHGLSHRDQAPKGTVAVPEGAIAIMLQGLRRGEEPRGAICCEADMIRAVVAARGTRPVMIKFHPFGATPAVKRAVADVVDPKAGVHLVEANVHDVLEAASMVVTQTSGVGFEAILHRKPTVLFAAADYAHVATRV